MGIRQQHVCSTDINLSTQYSKGTDMAVKRYSTGYRNSLGEAGGKSHADILANGIMALFGGTIPASADDAEGATPLILITLSSGAFTAGVSTNGINFDVCTAGVLYKKVGEIWSGVGTSEAASPGVVATWGRFYSNAYVTGASTTSERVDFDVATSGATLNLGNTLILENATTTVDNASLTISEAG